MSASKFELWTSKCERNVSYWVCDVQWVQCIHIFGFNINNPSWSSSFPCSGYEHNARLLRMGKLRTCLELPVQMVQFASEVRQVYGGVYQQKPSDSGCLDFDMCGSTVFSCVTETNIWYRIWYFLVVCVLICVVNQDSKKSAVQTNWSIVHRVWWFRNQGRKPVDMVIILLFKSTSVGHPTWHHLNQNLQENEIGF